MPGSEGMRQLLAADVTDEYAGLLEVSEKNRQLRELSERLRAAVGEAERLSVEKEYLDAKIRVHSGLGGLLAATARFMRAAGEERASGPVRTDETGGSGRFSDRQSWPWNGRGSLQPSWTGNPPERAVMRLL